MSLGLNDLMKVIVLVSLAFLLTLNGKEVRVFMLLQIGSRSIVLAFNHRSVDLEVYIHKDRYSKCSRSMIP